MPPEEKKPSVKIPPKAKPETTGSIKVSETYKEPTKEEEEQPEEQSGGLGAEVAKEVSPEAKTVNDALVETTVKVIGKTASLLTRIPEMDFDEAEVEQLKALWSPLIPPMSPILMAVMGTAIIVLSKVAIYSTKKKEKQPMKEVKLEEPIAKE